MEETQITSLPDRNAGISARASQNAQLSPLSQKPTIPYLRTLRQSAPVLQASADSANFAEILAEGIGDLVVVLLEPLEYFKPTTLEEAMATSHTLREIDRFLKLSSGGQRHLANTVVLDIRVFVTARVRATTTTQNAVENGERSFAVFQKMIHELGPKVVVTCQCGTANARNSFVRQMSSTFPPPSGRAIVQIRGQQVPLYKIYHPSVYKAAYIEQWVGSDGVKQTEFQKGCKDLSELIFRKAFRSLSNVTVTLPREKILRDRLRQLLQDKRCLVENRAVGRKG